MKRKIAQYLRRAEEIFTCHLQRGLGDGSPTGTVSGRGGAMGSGADKGLGEPGEVLEAP